MRASLWLVAFATAAVIAAVVAKEKYWGTPQG